SLFLYYFHFRRPSPLVHYTKLSQNSNLYSLILHSPKISSDAPQCPNEYQWILLYKKLKFEYLSGDPHFNEKCSSTIRNGTLSLEEKTEN
ncbi:MAG: hypothetical protein QXT80_01570, partial [Thermoplasmatales archaeon]